MLSGRHVGCKARGGHGYSHAESQYRDCSIASSLRYQVGVRHGRDPGVGAPYWRWRWAVQITYILMTFYRRPCQEPTKVSPAFSQTRFLVRALYTHLSIVSCHTPSSYRVSSLFCCGSDVSLKMWVVFVGIVVLAGAALYRLLARPGLPPGTRPLPGPKGEQRYSASKGLVKKTLHWTQR